RRVLFRSEATRRYRATMVGVLIEHGRAQDARKALDALLLHSGQVAFFAGIFLKIEKRQRARSDVSGQLVGPAYDALHAAQPLDVQQDRPWVGVAPRQIARGKALPLVSRVGG